MKAFRNGVLSPLSLHAAWDLVNVLDILHRTFIQIYRRSDVGCAAHEETLNHDQELVVSR